ncbi:uncharacterized protein LOC144661998 [Oculina patagonica]
MQTQQNKELPAFLFPSNIVKNEETLSTCTVKQEHGSTEETCHFASPVFGSTVKRPLIDSPQEATTPHVKRIKQEKNDPSFCEDKERIFLSSKTSLQNIVNEVVYSFENDNYENITSFLGDNSPYFDNANSPNRPSSAQADTVVFERKERHSNGSVHIAVDANEVKTRYESLEALSTSVDKRNGETSVLSIADQVQVETTKPILRTIKSLDSGTSEGFAYDHNFFPKLVGVHSISTPSSSSPIVESHHDFQQTTSSPPALEIHCQNQNIDSVNVEEAPNIYEVDPRTSSPANQIPRNSPIQSPTNFQSGKQYDLLFTFTQDDGKSDMFLVIKDKVFAVRRYQHKGESYLIHTDNTGKTSILAKAPREGNTGSQENGRTSVDTGPQRVLDKPDGTTNVSSIATEQSTHPSYQRITTRNPTQSEIRSTKVQNTFVHTSDVTNARERTAPATLGQPQTAYGDMRIQRRQLANQTNVLRAESSGHRQRPPVPAGQQGFPSQAHADRHRVVANGTLQNSTAIPINVRSQAPSGANTSSNIMSNQQFIVDRGLVDINQPRNNTTNVISQQQYTNTTAQIPYSENNTVISGRQCDFSRETIDVDNSNRPAFPGLGSRSALATNANRIAQRRKLMKYIAHQMASSEKPVLTRSDSSELTNVVNTRPQGLGRQTNNENVTNDVLNRTASINRCQEMARPLQQLPCTVASVGPKIAHADGYSTSSRIVASVGNNLGMDDVGQRYHPNQSVVQNSGVVHSQPHSDAAQRNVNLLQGGLLSNGEAQGSDKVLQIIESWKRHQQTIASNNTQFRQLRELLTRVDGSAQNTHSVQRERTATQHSQVTQPSTVASATPVISQISYGVISRSTDGENVSPKRTATALVIDQRHSVYVDATDSVIDEESRSENAGQQFSHSGNTVSGLHSNQSGNVAVSFPISSAATVNGWSQETGRPVNSNITSSQQLRFCSVVPQNSAPISPSYPSLATGFSGQRFYSLNLQPRTVPKIDKRCVANNTLNPIHTPVDHIPESSPQEWRFVPPFVSGQKSGINGATVRGNSEIDKHCQATKPCEVTRLGEVAKPCEAAKLGEVSKSCVVGKTNHLDKDGTKDVIEIIDSPPTRDSIPDSSRDTENNEKDKTVNDQQGCINEGPSKSITELVKLCQAVKNETDDEVEIMNPSLKPDSVDHKNVNKDSLNQQLEDDEQSRINALKAELIKKIKNTNERIAEEKIDWKKKYLNRLKIALTKKLDKLPGVIDVTVIDDD